MGTKYHGINYGYFFAFFSVFVWGITYISSKYLLRFLTPPEILICRVIIAYTVFFIAHPHVYMPKGFRSEVRYFFMGLFGTTLYFLGEIFALRFSTAANVSLLASTAPMITIFIAYFVDKSEKIRPKTIVGGLLCLVGMALVVLNGKIILKLNPIGDMLALTAAFAFAAYSIVTRKIGVSEYPPVVVTRKAFFYALLTLLPLTATPLIDVHKITLLAQPYIVFNLLFLGVVASAAGFFSWNKAIWFLGSVKATNIMYFMGPLTMLNASLILNENITIFAMAGSASILLGVYVSQRNEISRAPSEVADKAER
ncbi:MAG: DMT family transporter [Synergistes sp.]|nr:DMT family transporter [Synergistes sp.]